MAEIQSAAESIGQIQIADEVIAVIAGTAALEIDGVVAAPNHFAYDVAEILGRKNLSKGVKINVNGNEVSVELHMIVKFGYKVQDVAAAVQQRVTTAIETMVGLSVAEVNVNVSGVQMEKDRQPKDDK